MNRIRWYPVGPGRHEAFSGPYTARMTRLRRCSEIMVFSAGRYLFAGWGNASRLRAKFDGFVERAIDQAQAAAEAGADTVNQRDRPDGDYLHTCLVCGERFSGYKRDGVCMVCLPTLPALTGPDAPPIVIESESRRDHLAELCDALDALAAVIGLFCCDGGPIFAEHAETIAAVRLLARHGRCTITRDVPGDAAGAWLEADWTERETPAAGGDGGAGEGFCG